MTMKWSFSYKFLVKFHGHFVKCQGKIKLEKVSMGHGCPRLLFLFHLQLNIGYTISEQDTIYILQTEFIATLFL